MANQVNINVNANDLKDLICGKCECTIFTQAFTVKVLPALCSPTGKQTLVMQPCLQCISCLQTISIETLEVIDND